MNGQAVIPAPARADVKERPILFSAPMVRALLDGSKSQTRRVMKTQLVYGDVCGLFPSWYLPTSETGGILYPNGKETILDMCPHGRPGDRLWVRENYRLRKISLEGALMDGVKPSLFCDSTRWFDADGAAPELAGKCRPSIHMPRWASRILLEIVSVRVERLQDISEADARAEGIECEPIEGRFNCAVDKYVMPYRAKWRELWESINGTGAWAVNPWCWVVEFKRVQP